MERMPRPVALAPVRPGRRNDTVSTSLDAAHGQTASARKPARKKKVHHPDWDSESATPTPPGGVGRKLFGSGNVEGPRPLLWKTARNWSHDESDQGLAPSATSSIRIDDRLMSRWSRVASRPQCRSRDLTTARLAAFHSTQKKTGIVIPLSIR